MKLAVYDSKNTDRLLGTLEYHGPVAEGRHYRFAVMQDRSFYQRHVAYNEIARVVEVQVRTKTDRKQRQVDPKTRETVITETTYLATSAPLEDLMKVKGFTLPKEDKNARDYREYKEEIARRQAEHRRMMGMSYDQRARSIFGDY